MIGYERFVRLRRPLWEDFERGLAEARRQSRSIAHGRLEALALLYRQVLHDHALASARFARTAAARRLEKLALAGTHWLQRDVGERSGGLTAFFGRTFPSVLRRQLPYQGVAVALFAVTALFGLTIALVRPSLGTAFLGPAAMEDLAKGRLWTDSLVSVAPPFATSSWIATNNMSVAITGWAGGAAAGAGALYVVLLNGFMLGSIVGVTWHFGMAGRLLAFVAAHGPLEITLILVTAGAGLVMGRAVVEATDRPRSEVVREAGRDALIALLGCLPWFIVLGAVEGFISPLPGLPTAVKTALGIALELLFLTLAFHPVSPGPHP